MNEREDGLIAEFPVDLSREEFVRFNMRMAENRNLMRFRKVYAVAGGLVLAFTLALMALDYVEKRPFDPSLLILLIFVAITVLTLVLGVPRFVRHQTGKHFDKEMLDGKSYYGLVRVYPDRLEKVYRDRTITLEFNSGVVFLEYEDMMVFFFRDISFIFPARCVTASDAELLRAVSKKIPSARRLLFAKMLGRAETRMELPTWSGKEPEEDAVLYEVRVRMTAEELVSALNRVNTRAYVKWLPLFTGASLIAGVALGITGGALVMAGLFFAFMLFFALVNLWVPRLRVRARLRYSAPQETPFVFRFTAHGVLVSHNDGKNFNTFPWTGLVRAVEQTEWLEFHMNSGVFEIPKRCVEDMERLREIVNTYHTPHR